MRDRVDQMIDYTARTESGNNYSKINPDDNGAGLSFGAWQFNQKRGSLPKLLEAMYRASPPTFDGVFGPYLAHALRSEDWVRSEMNGHDTALQRRFEEAGRDTLFQAVQRDLARSEYFAPAWKAVRDLEPSERVVALVFDTAVQWGVGGLRRFLEQSEGDWSRFAQLADHGYGEEKGRRHRILHAPALSDAPFDPTAPAPAEPRTLRSGDAGEDVEELQLDLRRLGYAVLVTGTFGPITERLVCDFQRDHGLTTDGIYGPATRQALAAALAGKEGSPHA